MSRQIAFMAASLVLLISSGAWGQGGDRYRPASICRPYALDAQRVVQRAQQLGCGFSGPRWSVNPQIHMDWCMRATDAASESERAARQEQLRLCQTCGTYVQQAVQQNQANLQRRCGGSGDRWHSDPTVHRRWCVGVGMARAQRELIDRTRFLDQCGRGGRIPLRG
jgi:hypothetical protein